MRPPVSSPEALMVTREPRNHSASPSPACRAIGTVGVGVLIVNRLALVGNESAQAVLASVAVWPAYLGVWLVAAGNGAVAPAAGSRQQRERDMLAGRWP